MKLMSATIRPAKVLEIVEDGNGTIKVSAPGLFPDVDSEGNPIDTTLLPPIYPWPFGHHSNSYSCPKVDEQIWVMSFEDNSMQLYWVRKDDWIAEESLPENMQGLPLTDETQNLEVVVNREFEDSKWAILYFDNDDGWMMKKDEDGLINIRADGSILLKTNFDKRIIDICEDSIALGTEGQAEDNAMLFSKWKEWADELLNQIKTTLTNAASANPYTANLVPAFQAMATNLQPKIDPVKSEHVSITSN
jgi:hypothetical protein